MIETKRTKKENKIGRSSWLDFKGVFFQDFSHFRSLQTYHNTKYTIKNLRGFSLCHYSSVLKLRESLNFSSFQFCRYFWKGNVQLKGYNRLPLTIFQYLEYAREKTENKYKKDTNLLFLKLRANKPSNATGRPLPTEGFFSACRCE